MAQHYNLPLDLVKGDLNGETLMTQLPEDISPFPITHAHLYSSQGTQGWIHSLKQIFSDSMVAPAAQHAQQFMVAPLL